MPGDNGFWFDDNQDVAPRRPKPPDQNPKHPILDSQPAARTFSLEYAQLLAKGEDLQTQTVTAIDEDAEECEEAGE